MHEIRRRSRETRSGSHLCSNGSLGNTLLPYFRISSHRDTWPVITLETSPHRCTYTVFSFSCSSSTNVLHGSALRAWTSVPVLKRPRLSSLLLPFLQLRNAKTLLPDDLCVPPSEERYCLAFYCRVYNIWANIW